MIRSIYRIAHPLELVYIFLLVVYKLLYDDALFSPVISRLILNSMNPLTTTKHKPFAFAFVPINLRSVDDNKRRIGLIWFHLN